MKPVQQEIDKREEVAPEDIDIIRIERLDVLTYYSEWNIFNLSHGLKREVKNVTGKDE